MTKTLLLNADGITIQQLKAFLAEIPDENLNEEANTVWMEVGRNLSSPVKRLVALNYRPKLNQFDLLLET